MVVCACNPTTLGAEARGTSKFNTSFGYIVRHSLQVQQKLILRLRCQYGWVLRNSVKASTLVNQLPPQKPTPTNSIHHIVKQDFHYMSLGVRDSRYSIHCRHSLQECTEILGTKWRRISRKQLSEEEECFCLLENKQPSNWISWCLIDSDE